MTSANPRARHHVLGIVALSLFAALFTRLWYLQVLTTDEATAAVDSARTQTVIKEAPRGRILDRSGKVLVENRRIIQIQVDYQDFIDLTGPKQTELLRLLADQIFQDELRIYGGERVADDPGPRPEETTTTTAPDDLTEGTGPDGTTTTSTTTTVPEEDANSALDESGATTTQPDGPFTEHPPPAGVATGAQNPDGSGKADPPPPEPIDEDELRSRIEDERYSKFKPVPVATGISEELELYITEHPEMFPTVVVERVTARRYLYGALLAHVLGYVGSITEDELDEAQNPDKPYENDDDIGKAGIEQLMEMELRGTPGQEVYEVDARNRPIREITEQRREPVPGRDVYLTVDINMQYLMEKGLAAEIERRRGVQDNGCFLPGGCNPLGAASVAIDPRNGQVLAMASYPTYDPNLFVGGISRADYEAISADDRGDEHNYPLLNRAIGGQYAPGSTFKLFSAFAGLANGLITPDYVYNDTGTYLYSATCNTDVENNCSARNAGGTGNGAVDLTAAITRSSDTYFYKLGDDSWRARDRIGRDAMQRSLETWGLGHKPGIDLPGEATGRIPTPDWLMDFSIALNGDNDEARVAGTWTAGVSGNTMVGQGDVLVSPLQLAQGYATLANGGTVWKPQLVLQVNDYATEANVEVTEAEATGLVDLRPEWREPMVAGFDGVTKASGGTATRAFAGFDQSQCPVAGKTGTAQVTGKNDSSLFAAFAPTPTEGRESVIAMATVFQESGFGAAAAVPLTRRVLEPFASVGCDIERFGAADSPFTAPLGGWFDVDDAVAEYVPQGTDTVL
ncbi:MAG TPA: penicillin-binding transpeptidase domain-containing protein [Iamia sp.]|jgi:penicillin-binding protein 2|nr:penicillin-binding transpeptidase domain-containing protein [Iamia sp.]